MKMTDKALEQIFEYTIPRTDHSHIVVPPGQPPCKRTLEYKTRRRREISDYLLIIITVLATCSALTAFTMFLFPEASGWWSTSRFIGTTLIMSFFGYFLYGLAGE